MHQIQDLSLRILHRLHSAEEITSRKQIRLDERDHPKQRGDSSSNSYSTGIPVMLFSFS